MKCATIRHVSDGLIVCFGYGCNPCCRQHEGCDAIYVQSIRGRLRVVFAEIKSKLDPKQAEHAIKQLNFCRDHVATPRDADIRYMIIAESYTQGALRKLQRIYLSEKIPIERRKVNENDLIVRMILNVAR